MTHDDRGLPISPLSLASLQGSPQGSPQTRFAEHVGRFDFMTSSWRGMAALLLPMILLFIAFPLVHDLLSLPTLVESLIAGAIAAPILGLSVALFWRWSGGQMARTAVLHGLCGSCGYTLEALALAEDGCVQCPECGAAWRASSIKRPHWRWPIPRLADQSYLKRFRSRRVGEDDRGAWVQVLDSALRDVPEAVRLGADRREAIRRGMRACGRPSRLVLIAVLVATALITMGAAIVDDGLPLALAIILALITTLGIWMVQRSDGYIPRRGLCDVLKRHGVMPCCGEPMAGEPDESGCLTCPSCGAGWRKPR